MAGSIRDNFFDAKAIGALWDVAVSIKRGNPLPLDSNSVFASYSDLQTYAGGVLAYPGQIVAVVAEDATTIYYLDQNLAIQEVGKVPQGDDKSVEIQNEKISLHDFGKAFYKYTESKDGQSAAYVKTAVDETHPWSSGLEPKVVNEDGQLVLGWFEPNPTTVEGLQSSIATLQSDIDALETAVGDVYTKEETANLIASAGHLKRQIVETLPAIEEADENTIYMVAYSAAQGDNNIYEEYMVITKAEGEKAFEKIGDTKVDLNGFATENYVTEQIQASEQTLQSSINEKADASALEAYATTESLTEALADKVTTSALETALEDYVTAEALASEVATLNTSLNGKLDLATYNADKDTFATITEVNEKIGVAPTLSDEGTYVGATGIYVDIYTKDEVTALIADITGGESAADVLASLNAYKTSNNARVQTIENVINGTETTDGLVDRVEALENKEEYNLPVATESVLGGVKSSEAENTIKVEATGAMSVNSVNVNKLTQTEGDVLILDGGSSNSQIL